MIRMSLQDMATVVGGRLHNVPDPHALITAPPTPEPEASGGGLFVPVVVERPDGSREDTHPLAALAVKSGAVAVLTGKPAEEPAIVVPDVHAALKALAVHALARLTRTTVIGLTGSSGKTSTKDMTAHLLGHAGPTAATPHNFNDRTGLPLAIAAADASSRYLVLELGHHGPGDIRYLADIARPVVGAVLNVGAAHIGNFGSLSAIARAKGELVASLPADGLAVLNADDPLVRGMAARTRAPVVLVGCTPEAEVRAEHVRLDTSGHAHFTLRTPEGAAPVDLQLVGQHFVANALTAAAVARHVGLPVDRIAAALGELKTVSPRRMEVCERPDGVTVIDDTHNTTPESVRASLTALTALANGRDTVAVLGTMHKLGDATKEAHFEIGRLIAELRISGLVVVGGEDAPWLEEGARWLDEAARSHGVDSVLVPGVRQARAVLKALLEPGDVVLLKGPRFSRMQQLAQEVRNDFSPADVRGADLKGREPQTPTPR
ncbi:UDP-N-acetylmuramoyl-tripeptide--D-alanyl-D-alanine ligase [Streptomyces sp. WMMB 322]|uniref:UDP-N-acetylmuramoyl-tripeptide--D-alanyl-D- alanine ligase n=1 Tax=Streptomyces sp. WMMB 322 TaxID=1286821 RepID=UPI0006E24196|nr:UDP-N-acetylmuramoyl-tripeptide--D-alanyl-D-alanine ligase [Streptomyces sp. WMMB 322]SCK37838.1 UDP-N-acetylmuramoyl-tripeptide--D-alanyl-D-alanine ligase [Streptomyces sp. WMMB 322]